ncbi:MAG TPA: hypothetical protein VEN81_14760 [Planctomycetota bacterium]|nr:hypothetical protein [Planctomycetota bacterium]
MSKETPFRRRKKSPPTEIVRKPPGVDLWTFLLPYLQKLAEAYGKAVDILAQKAGRKRPEALDAIHTTVAAWISRWIRLARIRVPQSWEATLAHEAFHRLFARPRKDLRLVTFMPMAHDDDSSGFPTLLASNPSPLEEAIWNEANPPGIEMVRLVDLLSRSGFTLEQIAESLGISLQEVKALRIKGTQAPGANGPSDDFFF